MIKLKKISFWIFCLLIVAKLQGQVDTLSSNCACRVFVNEKELDSNDIAFKKYYRGIIKKDNAAECDDMKIIKDSGDYFLVLPFYEDKTIKKKQFWVKKKNKFEVFLTFTTQDYTSILYENPDSKSKKVFKKKHEGYLQDQKMTVLGCHKEWLKVSLKFNGKIYVGWTKYYCYNPCTTCC